MYKKLVLLLLLFSINCIAQNPGDSVQNFGSFPGFNGNVTTVALQNDGKILVGGFFNTFNAEATYRIIRLHPDGTKDNSFIMGSGFNNGVNVIAIQLDGKILVGGNFTNYKGITENYIVRLLPDGTKDTGFSVGTGFNGAVNSIVVLNSGKILIGGSFTSYNNNTENRIVLLNADGSIDSSLNTGTGFNNTVNTIAMQLDGKILVGGAFNAYKGVSNNRIIRLNPDGEKDVTFSIGTGFNSIVNAILQLADGKIVVGGQFTTYKGVTENRIVQLLEDGTKDVTFATGTGFDNIVMCLSKQLDGKLLVGGFFTSYKGISNNTFIALNTDGTKNTECNIGSAFNVSVRAITVQNDNKILVGGGFSSYNGLNAKEKLIRLNATGEYDSTFGNSNIGFNNNVKKIVFQTDGKMIVGGMFTSYKGQNENRIIRLLQDGSKDMSFNTGVGFNGDIENIIVQNDGKILLSGNFTNYNGIDSNWIIRLNTDGTIDSSFALGSGFNNNTSCIYLQNDGKILIGGNFTSFNGNVANRIIRLNIDGSVDSTFNSGTGFNQSVKAITVQDDGKILVGGIFDQYNGSTENRLIRLNSNGSKDLTFNINNGFDNTIETIVIQSDNKILVGGSFTTYNGNTQNRIIRLLPDGTKDTTFTVGTGFNNTVSIITTQTDGKIVVGGTFFGYDSVTENNLIRLNVDGTKDTTLNIASGFNNIVNTIALKNNEDIYVGGNFTLYRNSNLSSFIIGLQGNVLLSTLNFQQIDALKLYPNPTTNYIYIQNDFDNSLFSASIYNLQGKCFGTYSHKQIDVTNLPKGIYFMTITSTKGSLTKKFVKQ